MGAKTNRPKDGYAFVWNDNTTIKFYKSTDFVWETPSAPPRIIGRVTEIIAENSLVIGGILLLILVVYLAYRKKKG